MDSTVLIDGLLSILGLIILFTFHEFGHAWMALKCGDPTARDLGRVSLNPQVHIDIFGSIVLPLLMLFSGSGFLFGWAKPVPVNPHNLRNPRIDDILVTFAGPWMNILLAIVLIGLGRLGLHYNSPEMAEFCLKLARLSLYLFFFNLLPIPPLDGSHIVRSLIGMTYETYHEFGRYGFILLIIVMQIPWVQSLLAHFTISSYRIITGWFGMGF